MDQRESSIIDCIIFRLLFSLVYTGVVIFYYYALSRIDGIAGHKCAFDLPTATTITNDMKNFCDHIITWKTCGIFGIVFSGFLQFVLSLFLLYKTKEKQNAAEEELATKSKWYKLWDGYGCLTTVVNFGIFIILWETQIMLTQIDNTHLLKTAATIYMFVLGFNTIVVVAFFLGILWICLN